MALICEPTRLPEVLRFRPDAFPDARGFFLETFHEARYAQHGVTARFVQDNYSRSCAGTLRGLHYQLRHPQAKLVSVLRGRVYDVAVDIRRGSPTFGQWIGEELSGDNRCQLFIPAGFAHGFCVLSEEADFLYKCSDFYTPGDEHGILWCDPDLGIDWQTPDPVLSPKDQRFLRLADTPVAQLPMFQGRV